MKTKVLIYCTKAKPIIRGVSKSAYMPHPRQDGKSTMRFESDFPILNGKIVAECEVEVGEIKLHNAYALCTKGYHTFVDKFYSDADLQKASCLNGNELMWYLKGEKDNEKVGYALHISNLKLFDKPMKLSEVQRNNACRNCPFDCMACGSDDCKLYSGVRQAPQNMMWVWLEDTQYCLISIRPEWVAKILNGEKTIEVRKKVLKGMYEETL